VLAGGANAQAQIVLGEGNTPPCLATFRRNSSIGVGILKTPLSLALLWRSSNVGAGSLARHRGQRMTRPKFPEQAALKPRLPSFSVELQSKKSNVVRNYLPEIDRAFYGRRGGLNGSANIPNKSRTNRS
jgi:hypothetical protein